MSTKLVSPKRHSWWYSLAVAGKSVGIGIGAAAGVGTVLPPQISIPLGIAAAAATVITNYAEKGIKADDAEVASTSENVAGPSGPRV